MILILVLCCALSAYVAGKYRSEMQTYRAKAHELHNEMRERDRFMGILESENASMRKQIQEADLRMREALHEASKEQQELLQGSKDQYERLEDSQDRTVDDLGEANAMIRKAKRYVAQQKSVIAHLQHENRELKMLLARAEALSHDEEDTVIVEQRGFKTRTSSGRIYNR